MGSNDDQAETKKEEAAPKMKTCPSCGKEHDSPDYDKCGPCRQHEAMQAYFPPVNSLSRYGR